MKWLCFVMFSLACFSASTAQVDTITGRISYPNHNQTAPVVVCNPLSYDGSEVYESKVTIINSAGSSINSTSTSSGYTFYTIPGRVKLYPIPYAANYDPNYVNQWKNGVTADDRTIIQRHILNLEPILCPFRLIAADVNKSGSLSTLDLIQMQNLIVNNIPPSGQPWRFISKALVLPDNNADPSFVDQFWSIANTFAAKTFQHGRFLNYLGTLGESTWMDYWETSVSQNSIDSGCSNSFSKVDFFAIKMGDTNGNAQIINLSTIPALSSPGEPTMTLSERKGPELRTTLALLANERYEVKISAFAEKESICTYQVGLKLDDKSLSFEKNKKSKEQAVKQSDENFTTNKEELDKGNFRSAWSIDYATDKTGFAPNREVELFSFNIVTKREVAKITDAVLLDKSVLEALFFNYDVRPIKDVKLFISIRQLRPDEE